MRTPALNTSKTIIPMCYAYTTPGVSSNNGWIKIGYTEAQTVEDRIKQQTHTARIEAHEEWRGSAIYDDGSGESFTDHDFHAYLAKNEIERSPSTEWFKTTASYSQALFYKFKSKRFSGIRSTSINTYTLREEQAEAVSMAVGYYKSH